MYPMAIHLWKLGKRPFLGFLLLIGLLLGNALSAQNSRKALEAKRKRVEREIAQSQRILLSTQNKKQATLHQLNALNRIIVQREELIVNLEKEDERCCPEIKDKTLEFRINKSNELEYIGEMIYACSLGGSGRKLTKQIN